jgi:MFS superfamily sulfate permease-like transporter
LPNSALAAVVIAAAIGLFEIRDLRRIYRIQRWEFWLSIVCFAGVALFGAIPGIGIAVVIAVIEFLWDGWRPHSACWDASTTSRGTTTSHAIPNAKRVPGLGAVPLGCAVVLRQCGAVRRTRACRRRGLPTPVRRVVVAAEPVTSVDVTAADSVAELDDGLRSQDIELCFAEMKDPVKDKLKRFGSSRASAPSRFMRRSAKR